MTQESLALPVEQRAVSARTLWSVAAETCCGAGYQHRTQVQRHKHTLNKYVCTSECILFEHRTQC